MNQAATTNIEALHNMDKDINGLLQIPVVFATWVVAFSTTTCPICSKAVVGMGPN
ncbi:hypothetical protein A2U01_0043318 [Trifolium medium]|uniref:Uncharacterized protein n=1 Tax=Trifolium medium TaxID=97028 RepID=A0A392QE68_9FABA|nr:hypothetical protein [Trifolium medium]